MTEPGAIDTGIRTLGTPKLTSPAALPHLGG